MSVRYLHIAVFVLFTGNIYSQVSGLSSIILAGAKPEKLSGEFAFTEGPASDPRGNVYFTDQPNDRIMKWSTDDILSVFMQPSGRSNGMYFDRQGFLWSCADEKNEIWKISTENKKTEIISVRFNGKPMNGPNDLWVAPDGGVYFTDPFYRRTWWDHSSMPQEKECVYYLSPDRKTLISVADDLGRPNGIVGTPDGKILYVADIENNQTWSYTIKSDGTLSDKKLFCGLGSDGMTIDRKGNIYLTGKGVSVFDKRGRLIGNIEIPENWTANVCFGGKDHRSLFITASKSLYRLKTKMKGAY
ncbi:MAG TPA: SMP-30/gluconolactonase/LRE family protein [Bacteroidales bacterium]|jgi:gluconolactonase|nr:SMP-30/gluconolactonase/LRE family protein [Bacteroidales bacterium]HNR41310.1 SMP-30/gluconolactonase/LRE family protein [Bacteroidales bacterium]HPM18351.1 SMP-30/gluconolactonase/LRE family protein [Bacteroidales bacterium]HQG75995.1 SMP-30/gluconolactonase/LRE family protein [Bacteroidales bacterium]